MRPARLLFTVLSLAPLAATIGCAPEGESGPITAESDVVTRVPGNTIASPHAKPNATYLTKRKVSSLGRTGVHAFRDNEAAARLAERVDGIIANQPADGRFSLQELVQIEQPGFIETLFPEEQAALPLLWELLETVNTAPANLIAATPPAFAVVEQVTPASAPLKPATLDIDSLPTALQRAAERLQLARNADGDAATVSEADLDGAIATPGPYTPDEIAAFEEIKDLFLERAGTTLSAKLEVPAPGQSTTTLATWGDVQLVVVDGVEYRDSRSAKQARTNSAVTVQLEATTTHRAELALGATQWVLLIDETTDEEDVVGPGPFDLDGGTKTVEVWTAGQRVGVYRAVMPTLAQETKTVPLHQYANYTFVSGGTPLVKNAVSATTHYRDGVVSYHAEHLYETAIIPPLSGTVNPSVVSKLLGPGFTHPGRYEIGVPQVGKIQVDLFAEGFLHATRGPTTVRSNLVLDPNGSTMHEAAFSDTVRVTHDGKKVKVFFQDQVVFDEPLTVAHRKG